MSPITIILFISLIPTIQNMMRGEGSSAAPNAGDPHRDAVVSLWRLDSEGKEAVKLLCMGALIRTNWILISKTMLEHLEPLYTIGFYTGRSFDESRGMENSAIIEELNIPGVAKFTILVVKPGVALTTPFIPNKWENFHKASHQGFFIGWSKQDGSIVHPMVFSYQRVITLVTEDRVTNSDDFPLGSILVRGHEIVAFSNAITHLKKHRFVKIDQNVFGIIQKMSAEANNIPVSDVIGPYPDAVVAFWRLDEGRLPIKLLHVGALIESNWILVSRGAFNTLQPLQSIGVSSGRSYGTSSSIISSDVNVRIVQGTDRFIILVITPGIRQPTPYIATNPNACSKTQYEGNLVGWHEQYGPVMRRVTVIDFNGIHVQEEDSIRPDYFPLGSFIVRGSDIIAVTYNFTAEQEPMFLGLSRDDSKAMIKYVKEMAEARKKRKSEAERLFKRFCGAERD